MYSLQPDPPDVIWKSYLFQIRDLKMLFLSNCEVKYYVLYIISIYIVYFVLVYYILPQDTIFAICTYFLIDSSN